MPITQRRLTKFVDWIAPEKAKAKEFREHADEVLRIIKNKAIEMKIPVVEAMTGGSFDKDTGLRRHMRGDSEIEGQDIDLVFVVKKEGDGDRFPALVSDFEKVAKASYPDTDRKTTKCSVQLSFKSPLVTYDLVPVYRTDKPKYQLLVRTDMKQRLTSVQLHTEFVTKRTTTSRKTPGVVEFHECIRLLKWWRCEFQNSAYYLQEVPSVVIELLFAKVFDLRGVQKNYAETLVDWLWAAGAIVSEAKQVYFNDYLGGSPPAPALGAWHLHDPVNFDNVITKDWTAAQLQEFSDALKKAAGNLQTAIRKDMFGDEAGSLDSLVAVFGNAIRHHCGDDE